MSYRRIVYALSVLILTVLVTVGLSACPGPSDDPSANGSDPEVEEPVVEEPEVLPEDDPMAEAFRAMVNRENVNPEDLPAITLYGPFVFPESELDSGNSTHQLHPGDVEIYRLALNAETELETVADWYRDHLESGTGESTMDMPSGVTAINFNYKSPDALWTKDITVQGITGEGRCTVTVVMMRGLNPPPEEEGDSGEDSG